MADFLDFEMFDKSFKDFVKVKQEPINQFDLASNGFNRSLGAGNFMRCCYISRQLSGSTFCNRFLGANNITRS